jgi:hypothetical protein
MIQRAAAGYVEAFTADADDLAIRHTPFLTRPSVASNDDDLRSLGGRASLHVQAAAAGPGDQTVVKLLDNRRGLGCDSPLNDPKPSIRVRPKMFREIHIFSGPVSGPRIEQENIRRRVIRD